MIHRELGDESVPIKFGEFSLNDIGDCTLEIRPYEDDELPPKVYVITNEGTEVCSVELMGQSIIPSNKFSIDNSNKEIIADILNGAFDIPFLNKFGVSSWNMITKLWLGFNGPEDGHIVFPESSPYNLNIKD